MCVSSIENSSSIVNIYSSLQRQSSIVKEKKLRNIFLAFVVCSHYKVLRSHTLYAIRYKFIRSAGCRIQYAVCGTRYTVYGIIYHLQYSIISLFILYCQLSICLQYFIAYCLLPPSSILNPLCSVFSLCSHKSQVTTHNVTILDTRYLRLES